MFCFSPNGLRRRVYILLLRRPRRGIPGSATRSPAPRRSFDNPRAGSDMRIEEIVAEEAPYLLYELPVESPALVVIVEHDLDRWHRLDEPLLNPRHPIDHGDHSLQPVHPAGDDQDDLIGGIDPDLSRPAQPGRSVNDDVVI